jgi:hypothetical protein
LAAHNFTPEFRELRDGVAYASFLFNLVAPEGVQQVELRHGDTALAKVVASASRPEVSLTQPGPGPHQGIVDLSWTSHDPDGGDSPRYSLYYSQDGGATWDAAILSTTEVMSTLDTTSYPNCQDCRLRVIAHDGFYSEEARSDPFSVTNPPQVLAVWPSDGSMDAPILTDVRVLFRDSMDGPTITAATFLMTDAGESPVLGTVSYDEDLRQATFLPEMPLEQGSVYTVRLAGSVRDVLGQALGTDFVWSFRAEAGPGLHRYLPLVLPGGGWPGTSPIPAAGAQKVRPGTTSHADRNVDCVDAHSAGHANPHARRFALPRRHLDEDAHADCIRYATGWSHTDGDRYRAPFTDRDPDSVRYPLRSAHPHSHGDGWSRAHGHGDRNGDASRHINGNANPHRISHGNVC